MQDLEVNCHWDEQATKKYFTKLPYILIFIEFEFIMSSTLYLSDFYIINYIISDDNCGALWIGSD